jgi:transforming growth factor-beta-induced protein
MIKKLLAGVLLASVAVTAIAPATVSAGSGRNIVERAIAVNDRTGAFDTLLTAATCDYFGGAIANALATTDDITLFAPTDRAFKKLGRQLGLGRAGLNPSNICATDSILGAGTLEDILKYHVLPARVTYRQAVKAAPTTLTMFNGDEAKLKGRWWNLRIDGARIILPNVRASNGIIHVVNRVLTPPGL